MSSWEKGGGEVTGLEFRSYKDDAWHSVTVAAESGSLRIRYAGFPPGSDFVFSPGDFGDDPKLVDGFAARFRPVSVQLEDSHCPRAAPGLLVCASHRFRPDDVRFYDALVHAVERAEHSTEECLCTFILSWLHGPNAGRLTSESIAQIRRVQFRAEIDPIVASFVKRARDKFDSPPKKANSPRPGLRIGHKLSFSHHLKQETRSIEWCFSDKLISKWTFGYPCGRSGQDADFRGVGSHYTIVIENLEKDVTPFAIMEFLRREVSVSAQAFVLPSLSSETFTRGNVVADSKVKFERLCDFLENPNRIVVSSLGRPWVVTEKATVHNTVRASIETLTLISQNIVENRNDGSAGGLKVVSLGSSQYRAAKQLSDLHKEFSQHLKGLHKRLIGEEGQIWMKHNAEGGVGI